MRGRNVSTRSKCYLPFFFLSLPLALFQVLRLDILVIQPHHGKTPQQRDSLFSRVWYVDILVMVVSRADL